MSAIPFVGLSCTGCLFVLEAKDLPVAIMILVAGVGPYVYHSSITIIIYIVVLVVCLRPAVVPLI